MATARTGAIFKRVSLWILIAMTYFAQTRVQACYPKSLPLHMCVNTYLERDFPPLQSVLEQQRRGLRPLDSTLQEICEQFKTVLRCQEDEMSNCEDLEYMHRLHKAITGLSGVINVLCANNSKGLTELLAQAECFSHGLKSGRSCETGGFQWSVAVVRMQRLQQGSETCPELLTYHDCMLNNMKERRCTPAAIKIYNRTVEPWLHAWCFSRSSSLDALSVFIYVGAVILLLLQGP